MADHTVTLSIVGKKVVCEPSELHVRRGHTVRFGPIAHRGVFRGRLRENVRAAASGARFHEHDLKDENLELGVHPAAAPHWTHEHDVTIHHAAPLGAFAYAVSVETPDGTIDSDPVLIVEP
jgi:hypothetical protein